MNPAADKVCVKCTGDTIGFRYHGLCDSSNHEHLHYYCATCKYHWIGDTMDARVV